MLIKDLLGILEEIDSALISTYRILSESSSILWEFIEDVISRDSVKMVSNEVNFSIGSYSEVFENSFFY